MSEERTSRVFANPIGSNGSCWGDIDWVNPVNVEADMHNFNVLFLQPFEYLPVVILCFDNFDVILFNKILFKLV